jgi:hypothetical protein
MKQHEEGSKCGKDVEENAVCDNFQIEHLFMGEFQGRFRKVPKSRPNVPIYDKSRQN